MDIQNNIERYLQGQMTDAEKSDFEKDLEHNDLLREQFELQREIINQIKSRAFVNAQLEMTRGEVENDGDELEQKIVTQIRNRAFVVEQINKAKGEVKKGRTIRLVRVALSVAALFLGVVFIHGIWQNSQMEKLYAGNFEVYENYLSQAGILRGENQQGQADSMIAIAMLSYENKRYDEAIKLFDRIIKLSGEKPEIQFYKAISLLAMNKNREALTLLNELYKKPKEFAYYEETRWYLALANLKIHKKQRANELLNELIELEGYYFDKASKLIDKL